MKTVEYHGINVLAGNSFFPGSEPPASHEEEYIIFQRVLGDIKNISTRNTVEMSPLIAA